MTATIEDVRSQIARKYCRTLTVIDDDAYQTGTWESTNPVVDETYVALVKKCNEDSILCHLQYYPSGNLGGPDIEFYKKYFDRAVQTAKNSEVVILDWYLGAESSEHSIALLKELAADGALRFVIVYTKHMEDAKSRLESEGYHRSTISANHSDLPVEDNETFSPLGAQDSDKATVDFFSNENGSIFILVQDKPSEPARNTPDLLTLITQLMLAAYPDFLHWAGLELHTFIRENMPRILSTMPPNTDYAIVYQHLHTDMGNDTAHQIAKLYLDQLEHELTELPLTVVTDEQLWDALEIDQANIGIKFWDPKKVDTKVRTDARKKINTNESNGKRIPLRTNHLESGEERESHANLASLQEAFLTTNSLPERRLRRGTVLLKEADEKSDRKYYLCVTPECDLYRLSTDQSIYFIEGKERNGIAATKGPVFCQTFVTRSTIVEWENFQTHTIRSADFTGVGFPLLDHEIFADFQYVGQLKAIIVDRIMQRAWARQTRVGVNLAEFVRYERKEN